MTRWVAVLSTASPLAVVGCGYQVADSSNVITGHVLAMYAPSFFTGHLIAALILVDQGRITLDAPVSRYLPEFVGEGRELISVRHLLTHTSGLKQWQYC